MIFFQELILTNLQQQLPVKQRSLIRKISEGNMNKTFSTSEQQLIEQMRKKIDDVMLNLEKESQQIKRDIKNQLSQISQLESDIRQISSYQHLTKELQLKLSQCYAKIQKAKIQIVDVLKKIISTYNMYNQSINQAIMRLTKDNSQNEWLKNYTNYLQKCLHENILKGIPTPILLMIGPTLKYNTQ